MTLTFLEISRWTTTYCRLSSLFITPAFLISLLEAYALFIVVIVLFRHSLHLKLACDLVNSQAVLVALITITFSSQAAAPLRVCSHLSFPHSATTQSLRFHSFHQCDTTDQALRAATRAQGEF